MSIRMQDVWKKYPGTWALRGVNMTVEKGKVLGVLGENGSGKSTLFRILAGVTRPSRGVVRIQDMRPGVDIRRFTAYLPEIDPFFGWMRVEEQMRFLSAFYPSWDMGKTRDLLAFMELEGDRKISALSRGQKGRLKVVCAFSWDSAVVLMDEPLGGIDPPSRKRILDTLFKEFRLGEQTILISTHLVTEVEAFIEDVMFMKDGEIVLSGNVDAVREEQGRSLSEVFEQVAS